MSSSRGIVEQAVKTIRIKIDDLLNISPEIALENLESNVSNIAYKTFLLGRLVARLNHADDIRDLLAHILTRIDGILQTETELGNALAEVWDEPCLESAREQIGKFASPSRKRKQAAAGAIDNIEVLFESTPKDKEWLEALQHEIVTAWFHSQPKNFLVKEEEIINRLLTLAYTQDVALSLVCWIATMHALWFVDKKLPLLKQVTTLFDARLKEELKSEEVRQEMVIAALGLEHDTVEVHEHANRLQTTLETKLNSSTTTLDESSQLLLMVTFLSNFNLTRATRKAVVGVTSYAEEPESNEYQTPPIDSPAYLWNWDKIGQVFAAKSKLSATVDTGNGLFAKVPFKRFDVITQYCGDYYTRLPVSIQKNPNTTYLRTDRKEHGSGIYINGEGNLASLTTSQMGQIIQDPRNNKFINSENEIVLGIHVPPAYRDPACVRGRQVPSDPAKRVHFFDVATRDIAAGEEIFTDYGYDDEIYKRYGMIRKTD